MLHHQALALGSDFDGLSTISEPAYSPEIETMSEDRLQLWLIDIGYSQDELEDALESDGTLRDLAQDAFNRGHQL